MRGRREGEITSQSPAENGLGEAVRGWRRFYGLTVTDLAVQAGFGKNGRGYISRIEHGQIRHLGEERLERIATVLHLQSTDLLLHRMPERDEQAPTQGLDEAIICGKTLLRSCEEGSLDWARIQLLLAKLYYERALVLQTTAAKHSALIEARRHIKRSLQVFTMETTPHSFQEATQLGGTIGEILDGWVMTGSLAFLKRCAPQSLDWARIQVLLAKFYVDRSIVLQGEEARTTLLQAQHCVEAAVPIFTQKQAQRSLKEAGQLSQEILSTIRQMDGS